MNALPVLKPVEIIPLERPKFDNTQIVVFRLWVQDNAHALARYWHDCGVVLGEAEKASDADFDCWLHIQHDIESMTVERARA